MNRRFSITINFFIILVFSISLYSQVMIKAKPGEIMNLEELASIILQKDDKVQVEFVMPVDSRPKGYDKVDIQKGDIIFMANGKKVKKMKDLIDIYEKLKSGDKLKLALKRGDERRMISFSKVDPEKLPKRQMIQMSVDKDGKKKVIDSGDLDKKELEKLLEKNKDLQDKKVIIKE